MIEYSFWAFMLMLTPVVETRGGIPVGLALGVQPAVLFALSAISATLIFLLGRLVLEQFDAKVLAGQPRISRYLGYLQAKVKPYLKRFGLPGLVLFVAVPLPVTGVYSGTAVSWALGLDKKRSFIAVLCGGLISAGIVMAIAGRIL